MLHHALHIHAFELLKHLLGVEPFHLASIYSDDRAEIQEFAELLTVGSGLFAGFCGDFGRFGKHFESAVGSEVKHITVFLDASVDGCRGLHAEDGLHISRGCGVVASRQHQHTGPGLYADAGGETAARERYGACHVGVGAYGVVHLAQRILVGFLFVAVACHVDDFKQPENGMIAEHGGESLCRLNARHHPQRMAEDVAVTFVGKGVNVVAFARLCEQIEEVLNVLFVNELALVGGAEELAEVEGNVLVGKLVHEPTEVVSVDVHARKTRVGVMVAGMG